MRIILETQQGQVYEVPESEYDSDSLADAEIALRRQNSDGTGERTNEFQYSYQTNLKLCGRAAQIIQDNITELPTVPEVRNAFVLLKIYDDCCIRDYLLYEGRITVGSLNWCEFDEDGEACCIEVDTDEYTKTIEQSDCLRTTLIESDELPFEGYDSFWLYPHATMRYCLNHNKGLVLLYSFFLNPLMILITIVTLPLLVVIRIIDEILDLINTIVSVLPGVDDPIPELNFGENLVGSISGWFEYMLYPCNFAHITPKVKNYLKNACNHCDLEFESSILLSPDSAYSDLFYFFNQTDRGYKTNVVNKNGASVSGYFDEYGEERLEYQNEYFSNYSPNITAGEMLDNLAIVFNAEWWVENNTLRFEKRREQNQLLLDITQLPDSIKVSQCYDLTEVDRYYRLADFRWLSDGEDQSADNNKFLYQDVVKLSDNQNYKTLKKIDFPFGVVSCEGREKDNIIRMQELNVQNINSYISIMEAIASDNGVDLNIDPTEYEGILFLTTGTCIQPKLIQPDSERDNDGTLDVDFSVVKTEVFDGERLPQPNMWVSAAATPYNEGVEPFDYSEPDQSNKIIFNEVENLFQFFTDLDPDRNDNQFIGVEVEIVLERNDCDVYTQILNRLRLEEDVNHNLFVLINYGSIQYRAFVDEIVIDLENITITAIF